MTPLDLTQQPPRPCRVELDGIAYLPRAIDKVRATLPGGNLGAYLILHDGIRTVSGLFYYRMGITNEEFTEAVRNAQTDEDVAAWLRPRIDEAKIEKWHRTILDLRMCDIPSPAREAVYANHPGAASMPESTHLIDVLDTDDAVHFAKT